MADHALNYTEHCKDHRLYCETFCMQVTRNPSPHAAIITWEMLVDGIWGNRQWRHLDYLNLEVQDLCVFLSSQGHMPAMLVPIVRMGEKWKTCNSSSDLEHFSPSASAGDYGMVLLVEKGILSPLEIRSEMKQFFSSSGVSCYSRQRCGIKTLLLLGGRKLIVQASGILSSRVQHTLLYRDERNIFYSCLMHRMHLVKQV